MAGADRAKKICRSSEYDENMLIFYAKQSDEQIIWLMNKNAANLSDLISYSMIII